MCVCARVRGRFRVRVFKKENGMVYVSKCMLTYIIMSYLWC